MNTIDKLHAPYYYASKERPLALVNELNSIEAFGWRYEIGESPRGYYIRVFDEDNRELGNL